MPCRWTALLGTDRAYDARVIDIRPHPGQLAVADNLRRLLAGSGLLASHRHDLEHAVQDSYSLRCAPQVHGAVRDVLAHVESVLSIELGAVVDNPVIVRVPDSDEFEVMSTGNFHGEPLAFGGDMLAMALSELASISERRTDRMLDPAFSRGLPPFLATDAGTNSGYMLAQYTAASLVSENKVLAHPSSVDTIPTSGNQEDHVSMGWTSVRKLRDVVRNVRSVLAVELLCAAQAIDLRATTAEPSPAVAAAHAAIRAHVPAMHVDREVSSQIEAVDSLLPYVGCRGGRPWRDLLPEQEPFAYFGGLLATGLVEVSTDPAVLDSTGWWAVQLTYENEFVAARFADINFAPHPAGSWRGVDSTAWRSSMSRDDYVDAVSSVRESIARGDVYQANICRVLSTDGVEAPRVGGARCTPATRAPFTTWREHCACRATGSAVVSASPELFLRRDGDVIESSPIKGHCADARRLP